MNKQMQKFTDKEIINNLLSSFSEKQDEAWRFLYKKCFSVIETFIKRNNGSSDDAADIFQDSLIVFFNQIRRKDFELTCAIQTYLYSVSRNLWLKKLRRGKKETRLGETEKSIPIQETILHSITNSERQNTIAKLLDKLGKDCRKLLLLFYYERKKMRTIAEVMNISSEQVAKNKKSTCMKKLRTIVENSPIYQETLKK